jgi:uncharacterized protein with PIN domain
MIQAEFSFYAELNDFLPPQRRQVSFVYHLKEKASIKDTIEAIGVPHTEVDLIAVNGESVDFAYLVGDGDRIAVYPISASRDIELNSLVRPSPLQQVQFVLDVHLGKLVMSLRLLGFDALYRNDYDDEELAEISSREGRILLTQDRGLLKRSIVTYGYYVRSSDPQQQVGEVLRRFDLFEAIAPLRRCVRCNGVLESVTKAEIGDRLPPLTQKYYDEFARCLSCERLYWKGAHYEGIQKSIDHWQSLATK